MEENLKSRMTNILLLHMQNAMMKKIREQKEAGNVDNGI